MLLCNERSIVQGNILTVSQNLSHLKNKIKNKNWFSSNGNSEKRKNKRKTRQQNIE